MNRGTDMEQYENYIKDTSRLIAEDKIEDIGNAFNAYKSAMNYSKEVEFWRWMKLNYKSSGIFDSAESIQNYILSSPGRADWLKLQLQGKGYEWDWMMNQQENLKNVFDKFTAGIDPTQAGIDVVKTNLLNKSTTTYQHKSYTSNTKVNGQVLKNTPKDATVVTQSENAQMMNSGGRKVESFQTKAQSNKIRDQRFEKASKGAANSQYTLQGVSKVMGKAALVGAAIGCTVEALSSYERYKSGQITKKEYLIEIAKSGGNAGVTGGITAGIMIPIGGAIAAAGVTIPITIPIAIAVGAGVDKIIAPMFKKGQYLEDLNKMKFYDDIGQGYLDFIVQCEESAAHFESYLGRIIQHENHYRDLRAIENEVDQSLMNTLDRF
jgi:hypothetical protein